MLSWSMGESNTKAAWDGPCGRDAMAVIRLLEKLQLASNCPRGWCSEHSPLGAFMDCPFCANN